MKNVNKLVKSTFDWLVNRPGYMLLTARDERLSNEPAERFHLAWMSVMVLSLLCGVGMMNVWGWAWWVFRDYGVIIVPAMMTTGVMVLWPFRRAMTELANILGGNDPTTRAAAAAMLVVMLVMSLIRMNSGAVYGEGELPLLLRWIRPQRDLYRVLLLMPIWGGWSMLIVGQFYRPDERTEPAVRALVRGCGPVTAAACMGAVLAASILYFSFLPWTQLVVSGVAIASSVLGGPLLCRFTGGLKRRTLLAGNLLTQLSFLLAYLAIR